MVYKYTVASAGNSYLAKLRQQLGETHKFEASISKLNAAIERAESKLGPEKVKALNTYGNGQASAASAPVQNTVVTTETLTKITALQAQVKNLEQQLAVPKELSDADLVALGNAAYGNHMAAISRNFSGNVAEGVARNLFLDGVRVPGLNTDRLEQQVGKAKPLHGMRRIQAAELQQKIDSWMSKQK
jgi:LysM repeat protein